MDQQTFRQQCAIAAMREIVAAATRRSHQGATEADLCRETAEASFAFADAMVAAANEHEIPRYGAAPSRSGGA